MRATINPESIPPERKAPRGTSAIMRRPTASPSSASRRSSASSSPSCRRSACALAATCAGSQKLETRGSPRGGRTRKWPGSSLCRPRWMQCGEGTWPQRMKAPRLPRSISGVQPGCARSAFSSEPNRNSGPNWPQNSGLRPIRSRARVMVRAARSQTANANMPMSRRKVASTPQAAQASTRTSVSECPRKVRPDAASSARNSAWL